MPIRYERVFQRVPPCVQYSLEELYGCFGTLLCFAGSSHTTGQAEHVVSATQAENFLHVWIWDFGSYVGRIVLFPSCLGKT